MPASFIIIIIITVIIIIVAARLRNRNHGVWRAMITGFGSSGCLLVRLRLIGVRLAVLLLLVSRLVASAPRFFFLFALKPQT